MYTRNFNLTRTYLKTGKTKLYKLTRVQRVVVKFVNFTMETYDGNQAVSPSVRSTLHIFFTLLIKMTLISCQTPIYQLATKKHE